MLPRLRQFVPQYHAMSEQPNTPPKRENIWLNLGLNVLIPSLLLTKGQPWLEKLSGRLPAVQSSLDLLAERGLKTSAVVLIIALAFPIIYGIYDFIVRKKYNFFSVLGFVSVLISGGIGLFELNKDWVAVKEAAIPALFAVAVLVSLKTPFPLVRTFLFSPEIFDVPKIETALAEKGQQEPFEKLMSRCTLMLSGSFVFSAILNYFLAKYFIRSESTTDAFNVELGKMQFWSWPVITVPSMVIMFYILNQLINGIHAYTGYELEDVMLIGHPAKEEPANDDSTIDSKHDGSKVASTSNDIGQDADASPLPSDRETS